ncbi:MAG TPA: PstS family phosphate ABC transporter substrate-binding protein [Pirellulaceae bacterium]|jgi:phosphate transport system substrate-binding protein
MRAHIFGSKVAFLLAMFACFGGVANAQTTARKLLPVKAEGIKPGLSGKIQIDGSSTVYKISQLAAEEFSAKAKDVEISVAYVGTGGGFKSFPEPGKKLDICDASRPIQQTELENCQKNGVKFIELPIGIDAITIVVGNKNTFIHDITLAELQKLWAPGANGKGTVTKWSQVRKGWPDQPVALFGADSASGTFEYFNEAVHHDKKTTRNDYTANANDNILIQGVEKNQNALGYIPYAYYVPRSKTLRAVKIKVKESDPGVEPTIQAISSGNYHPFARPLFIYANIQSLQRPEVANFVQFYIDNAAALTSNAGYIPFDLPIYAKVRQRLDHKETGTAFGGKLKEDMDLKTIMDLPVQY